MRINPYTFSWLTKYFKISTARSWVALSNVLQDPAILNFFQFLEGILFCCASGFLHVFPLLGTSSKLSHPAHLLQQLTPTQCLCLSLLHAALPASWTKLVPCQRLPWSLGLPGLHFTKVCNSPKAVPCLSVCLTLSCCSSHCATVSIASWQRTQFGDNFL